MSEPTPTQQTQSTEAELIAIRREKLAKLRDLGIDPYGARYATSHTPASLREAFEDGLRVKVAGRITGLRDMGRSVFFHLGDVHGSIQGYLNTKGLDESQLAAWRCLDRGDWIGIEGETFLTKTGEPTVKVESFTVLSKSLRPMPDKFHGLADRETKYRKRHLDLMGNADSASLFVTRSLMLAEIRSFLQQRGFLEVETPMLQDVAGGAAARPFETHHNALGMPLTLRIAPELFLKRLLVGGFTKIFELNRNFRNEGISRRHNPEFTMLEAYWAFSDFEQMAELVEEMTCHLAKKFCGGLQIEHKDEEGNVIRTIDLTRPWRRANYHDLVKQAAGGDFFDLSPGERRSRCEQLGVQISPEMEDYEVVQQVFEKLVEEHTFDPCFVVRVPSELIPLAKLDLADAKHDDNKKMCSSIYFFSLIWSIGASIDELAPLYQVSRATVARWLASARQQLQKGTLDRLSKGTRLEGVELDGLMASLESGFDVSLRRFVEEAAPGDE
jgi:lysyl-tRNA synthetase class 2